MTRPLASSPAIASCDCIVLPPLLAGPIDAGSPYQPTTDRTACLGWLTEPACGRRSRALAGGTGSAPPVPQRAVALPLPRNRASLVACAGWFRRRPSSPPPYPSRIRNRTEPSHPVAAIRSRPPAPPPHRRRYRRLVPRTPRFPRRPPPPRPSPPRAGTGRTWAADPPPSHRGPQPGRLLAGHRPCPRAALITTTAQIRRSRTLRRETAAAPRCHIRIARVPADSRDIHSWPA